MGEESSALVELEQTVAMVVARVSVVQKLFLSLLLSTEIACIVYIPCIFRIT